MAHCPRAVGTDPDDLRTGDSKDMSTVERGPASGPTAASSVTAVLRPASHEGAEARIDEILGRTGASVSLSARHMGSGEIFERDPHRVRGTASAIKVAVMAELYNQAAAGRLDLSERLTLRAADVVGGSGVLHCFQPGLTLTLADLCELMMAVSDNTATNLIIDRLGGVEPVNAYLEEHGLPTMRLNHKIGIPAGSGYYAEGAVPASRPLGEASAADLRRFVEHLAADEGVSPDGAPEMVGIMRRQQGQDGFARYYTGIAAWDAPASWEGPGVAAKAGRIPGSRTDCGLVLLPDGQTLSFGTMVEDLEDKTLISDGEGSHLLGAVGAALLAYWWPGEHVPVRIPRLFLS